MTELGSGSGSSYPSALDTNAVLEVNSPNGSKTKARAEVPNDHGAAIVAVQTELGTDPAGSLADVKTYLQTEHAADGTHGAITPTSVTSSGAISGTSLSTGDETLKFKVVDIGDWDMSSVTAVNIAHGLTLANIRGAQALIRNDDATTSILVVQGQIVTLSEIEANIGDIDATNVDLLRKVGGIFDSINYNSTSYNRGWITIWYV